MYIYGLKVHTSNATKGVMPCLLFFKCTITGSHFNFKTTNMGVNITERSNIHSHWPCKR